MNNNNNKKKPANADKMVVMWKRCRKYKGYSYMITLQYTTIILWSGLKHTSAVQVSKQLTV